MLQAYFQPAIGYFPLGAGLNYVPEQIAARVYAKAIKSLQWVSSQTQALRARQPGFQDRETDAAQVLVGLFQAFQAAANQQRIDEIQRDALRDQVYAALRQIRFLIRHGQVSGAQAREAGTSVVEAYFQAIGQLASPSVRASAENYRAVMTDYANLNGPEAEWFYRKWDCPDVTTQAQIGPDRCVALSAATVPPVTTPPGQQSPVGGVTPLAPAAGSIFDLLGTINLGGFAIPVLPVVAIGAILLLSRS